MFIKQPLWVEINVKNMSVLLFLLSYFFACGTHISLLKILLSSLYILFFKNCL
jgi:hypothetical protein